ncbi:MAG: hypothetical protein KDC79_00185 [Cyclobacteriaceae bacterium]|nr:hypothetical protein [Cyclobacteriaceae bacterium]
MKISILLGLLVGAMAFPFIILPLTGVGMVVWGFYVLFHDIAGQHLLHHHRHTQ